MDTSAVRELLSALTSFDLAVWSAAFLLILAGMGLAVRFERRRFQALGKGSSWFWLRLLSLPILALTGFAVLLPARLASGPEALAYFYLALFIVGPLIWFGLHWMAGSMMSQRLTRAESTGVALTGLALLIVPALAVNMLHGPLFMASHLWKERVYERAERTSLVHEVLPMQRYRLGEPDDIYAQTLRAPAGVRLERVDVLLGGEWQNTKTVVHSYFCRQDDDLHMAWPAGSLPSPLRLYWKDKRGDLQKAEFQVDSAGRRPAAGKTVHRRLA